MVYFPTKNENKTKLYKLILSTTTKPTRQIYDECVGVFVNSLNSAYSPPRDFSLDGISAWRAGVIRIYKPFPKKCRNFLRSSLSLITHRSCDLTLVTFLFIPNAKTQSRGLFYFRTHAHYAAIHSCRTVCTCLAVYTSCTLIIAENSGSTFSRFIVRTSFIIICRTYFINAQFFFSLPFR